MILDLILSTIAFFVAVYYLRKYFNELGFEKGFMRALVIFLAASALSTGVSAIVEKLQGNSANPLDNAAQVQKQVQNMMGR
ncbi:MAG: hypothetical protein HKL98_08780 [Burkholderiales bacterium]|nr:hypothetical protein [Burkholderiales bacterium]